ncbi:YycH family regulatory protein [Lentibacillus sediminis]|uniref:YycH family regulatory protein n=1 Tax=Lentibacillus sediminis TaxID=1940529 RepID=UPI000C1C32E5|nr:two-component system activity regulator YycH [Lentibacillus sediminis]
MKLETIKSFVLVFLIGVSLLLTFGLWSYQPNLETVSSTPPEDEVSIGGGEQTEQDIIQPSSIIFHAGENHYGYKDPSDQQNLYREMQSWTLEDFATDLAEDREREDYEVEMVFPDALPMELINSLFTFEGDGIEPPSWSFDRMYFTFLPQQSSIEVEFLSVDGRQQATALIHNPQSYDALWEPMTTLEGLRELIAYEEGQSRIYLPADSVTLRRYTSGVDQIEPHIMVNALFSNPAAVNVQNATTGTRGESYYSDGERGMNVYQFGASMEYNNPSSENAMIAPIDLLDRSIQNINAHGGWTDNYRLMELETNQNLIRYQMHYNGLPVFNSSNLATIEQQWGSNGLIRYRRPLINLSDYLDFEEAPIDLPSGYEVIEELESYDQDSLQAVTLGYQLNYLDEEQRSVVLEPKWYMNYGGNWTTVHFEDRTPMEGGN